MKTCARCAIPQPLDNFYRKTGSDARFSACKRCTLDSQKKPCACGCGTRIWGKYLHGHRPLSDVARQGTTLPTIEPKEVDIAWAAGFIEGEGHIRLNVSGRSKTQMVNARQVNREPLERLLCLFGGTIYSHDKKRLHPTSSWQVTGPLARRCLELIALQLSTNRRSQAEDALAGKRRDSWAHVSSA